jgi:hypothetical protein
MLMRSCRARVRPSLLRVLVSAVLVSAVLVGAPAALGAQVGYRPSESPFEDVKLGHNLSISAGYMFMENDPAGVAPKSGGFGQFRYDAAVGGPASLFARWTIIPTTRALKVPGNGAPPQVTGYPSVVMHVFDGGIDLSLTGNKTWHHLQPSISSSVGMVTDFASVDSSGYKFGNKFEFSIGFVMRYMHKSGVRMRFEISTYAWQYDYPQSYYLQGPNGGAVIVNSGQDQTPWGNNLGLSAGASIPLFR